MDSLSQVSSNMDFLGEVYNLQVLSMLIPFLMFLVLWELVWKGFALWRAARLKMTGWFIAMLLINSAGVVPITFILVTKKRYRAQVKAEEKKEMEDIASEVLNKKKSNG